MTDRTVVVRLLAEVGQYQTAMAGAGRTAMEMAGTSRAAGLSAAASMAGVDRSVRKSASGVSRSLGSVRGMITNFGVPLLGAVLVKSFMDFESQMAKVRAIGDPFGQTASGARKMGDAALEMGQKYGFSAVEVGKAEEELAKAGLHTTQILGGSLQAALTLAAAGDVSLANSAKYLSVTMTQFDKKAADTAHIADLLSQAANATVSGVDEMATSLSYVGPQAHAMGISLEDTVTAISLFNRAGIDADMAGTNLRGLLVSLTSPSHLAQTELAKLGVTLYDSKGKFISLANMAQQLQTRLGAMSDQDRDFTLGRIASNHQLQGALILYKAGAKGLKDMETVIKSQSTAEEVAKAKTENFTGTIKRLGSVIQSDFIGAAEKAIPVMEPLVEKLIGAAHWFGELGGAAQLAGVALAGQLLIGRKMSTSVGGFRDNLKRSADTTRDYAVALRELNRMESSSVGAVSPVYAGRVRALDDMVTGLHGAQGEVKGLAGVWGTAVGRFQASETHLGRLGAIGKGAFSTMKLGVTGLTSAMGGPWMLAIEGVTLAWMSALEAEAKQKQAHEDLVDSLDSLGQSYKATGDISKVDLKTLYDKNSLLKDLASNSKNYGVTIEQVAKASSGDLAVQKQVLANLDAKKRSLQDQLAVLNKSNLGGGGLDFSRVGSGGQIEMPGNIAKLTSEDTRQRQANKDAIQDQIKAIEKLYPALKEEFEENKALTRAWKDLEALHLGDFMKALHIGAAEASPYLQQLADDAMVLASGESEAADKAKALQDSLGLLQTSINGTSDAMAGFRGSSIQDTFFEKIAGKKATKGSKGRLVNDYVDQFKEVPTKAHWERTYTGDRTAEGGKVFSEEWVPAGTKRVKAARKKIGSHREGATKGEAAVPETYAPLFRTSMIDTVTGKFRTLMKVNGKYNDGLTQTSVKFDQFMSGRAQKSLGVVSAVFTEATLAGATAGEAAEAAALRFAQVRKEMIDNLTPIVGNRKAAEKLVTAYLAVPKDIESVFLQPGMADAMGKAAEYGVTIEKIPNSKDVVVVAETKDAATKLGGIKGKVEKLPDGRFIVRFPNYADATKAVDRLVRPRELPVKPKIVPPAKADLGSSINAIEHRMELELESKQTVAVKGNQVNVTGGTVTVQGGGNKTFNIPQRWGGIHSADGGGLRQAKLAKPGAPLYQWAEEGTGGEAFVPRFGRRDDALAVLRQASAWYGQELIPAGKFPGLGQAPARTYAATPAVMQSAAGPAVNVQVRAFLGNEELTDRMRFVVDQRSDASALQAAWGRRA